MSQRLPDHLDPWRFAEQGKRLSGTSKLKDLPRLVACLADSDGEVRFDLEFYRDGSRRACLRGSVTARLCLECQRCLDKMELPVDSAVSLAFVESLDEAERLPDNLDPQLVEEGRIGIRDLIEDELLLALPQVALHPEGDCTPYVSEAGDSGDEGATRANPFAVLEQLKRKDH
jgi:uncharacterized protein